MSPRARSTPYAVLGMLSLAPMSGYEIRKTSESGIGHFWSESYGQIYPALRDLKAQGLIRRRPGAPRGGSRDRHVYEITERGLEALAAWRALPPRATPGRNELLLKVFFGRAGEPGPEIEWIDALHDRLAEEVREYARIRKELERTQRDHPSLPYWLLTLSYGEHHARSLIRWCRESRDILTPRKGTSR